MLAYAPSCTSVVVAHVHVYSMSIEMFLTTETMAAARGRARAGTRRALPLGALFSAARAAGGAGKGGGMSPPPQNKSSYTSVDRVQRASPCYKIKPLCLARRAVVSLSHTVHSTILGRDLESLSLTPHTPAHLSGRRLLPLYIGRASPSKERARPYDHEERQTLRIAS